MHKAEGRVGGHQWLVPPTLPSAQLVPVHLIPLSAQRVVRVEGRVGGRQPVPTSCPRQHEAEGRVGGPGSRCPLHPPISTIKEGRVRGPGRRQHALPSGIHSDGKAVVSMVV